MRNFDIPIHYKSSFVSALKELRKKNDPRKKNLTPTLLDFGPVQFYVARHFGFCYGVENAIEKSYKAIEENPNKRIFLLSQMIHNPEVNKDLQERGIQFIMDTAGNQFIDWKELKADDIVIIPAFGTTIEIQEKLKEIGIETQQYNTTCPFVEKVWNMSGKLGKNNFSVIIHGKHNHEETRATFSHSAKSSPSVVIRDQDEAQIICDIIEGTRPESEFYQYFKGKYSEGFSAATDLQKVGVVNQTTMLASETLAISEMIKKSITKKHGEENYKNHFADTRDTLCYATNDNQMATYGLLEKEADLAIVVGGYNSSNTSHLVELCEEKFPTYFISSSKEIESREKINHFNFREKTRVSTTDYLMEKQPIKIILTCGASCPDTIVEAVLDKILSFYPTVKSKEEVISEL